MSHMRLAIEIIWTKHESFNLLIHHIICHPTHTQSTISTFCTVCLHSSPFTFLLCFYNLTSTLTIHPHHLQVLTSILTLSHFNSHLKNATRNETFYRFFVICLISVEHKGVLLGKSDTLFSFLRSDVGFKARNRVKFRS